MKTKQRLEEEKRMIENQKDKKTNICDDCGDGFCNKYVLQKHKINSCKYSDITPKNEIPYLIQVQDELALPMLT